jgi:hypothetical protein
MLVLEKGKLRKQSYVRLEHTYEVPVSMLTQYSGGRCRAYKKRLSNESYTILMENLGLASEVFEETATLFETTEGRLSKLANAARRSQNENLLLNRTENSQRLVFPTLNQHSPAQVSRSTPPTSRYGATSFTQSPEYLPLSYSHTQPYPSSPEDSGDDLASLDVKCFLGIVVIVVGSFVWWKYSR